MATPGIRLYHHPHHAHLGDEPLAILDASFDPTPHPEIAYPTDPTDPTVDEGDPLEDRLLHRLDAILGELEGLRADLASRTLGARLRRLWAWLTRQLVRS